MIYVGDSANDVVAAKAAGAYSVAALWDATAKRENFHLAPDFWAETPEAVWSIFLQFEQNR